MAKKGSFDGDKVAKLVTEKVLASLEKFKESGKPQWFMGLQPGVSPFPVNADSGNRYRGINTILALIHMEEQGYKSNRWITMSSACGWTDKKKGERHEGHGATMIKGSKALWLVRRYWVYLRNDTDSFIKKSEYDKLTEQGVPCSRFLSRPSLQKVFNVECFEGLPDDVVKGKGVIEMLDEHEAEVAVDEIAEFLGVPIKHQGSSAFYSPPKDQITLPPKEVFSKPEFYLATKIHEMVHATGHKSRLNRLELTFFGSETYAKEELVAELGSAFLGHHLGIDVGMQHDTYIGSWIKALKDDPKWILEAAEKAEYACSALLQQKPMTPKVVKA